MGWDRLCDTITPAPCTLLALCKGGLRLDPGALSQFKIHLIRAIRICDERDVSAFIVRAYNPVGRPCQRDPVNGCTIRESLKVLWLRQRSTWLASHDQSRTPNESRNLSMCKLAPVSCARYRVFALQIFWRFPEEFPSGEAIRRGDRQITRDGAASRGS